MSASITSKKEIVSLLNRMIAALELGDFSECDEVPQVDVDSLIIDAEETVKELQTQRGVN